MGWLADLFRARLDPTAPPRRPTRLGCGCLNTGTYLGHMHCNWTHCDEHGGMPHDCEEWQGRR